jgi:catechol 2,3-dioxygenase-like lactoylglutathione lyase family enzyme
MITGINHITLAVKDIEKSFSFYREVLGFTPLIKWDRGAYFLIGDIKEMEKGFWFCLHVDPKRQPHDCYTHYAFSVSEKDFETMVTRITTSCASLFQENRSPGKSIYFLDPDDHKLEIHVGTFEDRITAKKKDQGEWKNVEWFV